MDYGFGAFGVLLVIFRLTAIPVEPTKSPFNDPAFGQDCEGVQLGRFAGLDQVTAHGFTPVSDIMLVAAIHKDVEWSRKSSYSSLPPWRSDLNRIVNIQLENQPIGARC
jgi:hypothetical protein